MDNIYRVKPGGHINLSEIPTTTTEAGITKDESKKILKNNIKEMFELQNKLYAHDKYSLLIVFQAMDAAGKDSTIKHVMSGLNPQGTQVFSFKQPSQNELDHDYLWRIHKSTPERGRIGIFNRSHYEEVLVVRVHNLISNQKIPGEFLNDNIWEMRYREINDFEKHLYENGTFIIKFFLHVSKEEQKQRFLKRIEKESKNWKFSEGDVKDREFWNDYQTAYQETISATSTDYAPWYIIPADNKWFIRYKVSEIIVSTMNKMKLHYPVLTEEQKKSLLTSKEKLLNEK